MDVLRDCMARPQVAHGLGLRMRAVDRIVVRIPKFPLGPARPRSRCTFWRRPGLSTRGHSIHRLKLISRILFPSFNALAGGPSFEAFGGGGI